MEWDKLKGLVPYVSIYFILLGFSQLHLYYNHFDIPIKYFLTPSEIIFGLIDNLPYLLLMLLSPLASIYEREINKGVITPKEQKSKNRFSTILLTIVILLMWTAYFITKNYDAKFLSILLTVTVGSILLFNHFVKDYQIRLGKAISQTYLNVVYLMISLFMFLQIVTLTDIDNTDNLKYYGTQIVTSDSTYLSDSSHSYIGRTNEFTFVYNFDKKYSEIIPNSEIKKFRLKTNQLIKHKK